MTTEFTARFLKDLDRLNQKSVKNDIRAIIEQVEAVSRQSEIINIKKLRGHPTAHRIRSGDYRIGIFIENNVVEFICVAHRKDIYRIFP
jgi:mRNA interferase RelE/StbE